MLFLHMADVHLGNQQYNAAARFNDFGRAFFEAVDLAVTHGVQACVIAGDLFHKAAVEPATLIQAEEGLERLHDAGIPVIAVHGNHDNVRFRAQFSWLDYLAEKERLHLLSPVYEENGIQLVEGESYLDIGAVRFVGVPWLGASAAPVLAQVADALAHLDRQNVGFTVLVTHAGVEGQMPHIPGALTFADLSPLKNHVQYLALGHLHKPYEEAGWIYNPGSLETCSFDEAQYENRGVYLVSVDESKGTHQADLIRTPRRPFYTLYFDTDRFATPAELVAGLRNELRGKAKSEVRKLVQAHPEQAAPVVRLVLRGNLTFDRASLDIDAVRSLIRQEIEALLVRVDNRTRPLGSEIILDEGLDRAALERRVLEQVVLSDSRYSLHPAAWSELMQSIKRMALDAVPPDEIFAALDRHMSELEGSAHVDH